MPEVEKRYPTPELRPDDKEAVIRVLAEKIDHHFTEGDEESGCALRCGYAGEDRARHLAEDLFDAAFPLIHKAIAAPVRSYAEGMSYSLPTTARGLRRLIGDKDA